MSFDTKDKPSSVTQLAAAMAALGLYRSANTPAEHTAEAKRLGGDNAYHVQLANALLGAAQTEAILADALLISPEARRAAYEQQLKTAGTADDPRETDQLLALTDTAGRAAAAWEMPITPRPRRSLLPELAITT
jgi:hypothetical protein